MKTIKHIINFVLVLFLGFSIIGCGSSSSDNQSDEGSAKGEPTKVKTPKKKKETKAEKEKRKKKEIADYQALEKKYLKQIEENPESANAYNSLCVVYTHLKKYDKAIQACKKGLKIKPDSKHLKSNLNWAKKEKARTAGDENAGAKEATKTTKKRKPKPPKNTPKEE